MATFGIRGGSMERITTRVAAAAATVGLALLAVGCTGNATTATGTNASPASATSRALADPFTITARYTAQSLGLSHPHSFAVGPDGNLYVTDLNQQVTVISPDGKVLRRWGKQGHAPGEFDFVPGDPTVPTDVQGSIAVGPDGKVYVSDSGNARVQVFTPQGQFVRQFGSYGSGKGQFLRPFDLAVDRAGNVYVADDQAEDVSKFSPSGKVIWQIGGASGAPDLVGHHHFTMIDAHGRIVMVNDDVQKVVYLDSSGHEVDAFSPNFPTSSTIAGACEATVDAVGNTYVSGCGPQPTGPTLVFDRTHRLIAKWPGTPYSLLRSPAFGPHGEVFALATDGTILKLRITLPGA
jgi:DNA-binding beta-propeller fold protein YncE